MTLLDNQHMDARGIFIVVEGPRGAGQGTTIAELRRALCLSFGLEVVSTTEAGSTPFGEGLRTVLQNPYMTGGSFASALVYNGARKEHADRVISPAIERGAVLLCDRYTPSTDIFEIELGRGMSETEKQILRGIHDSLPQPDLTVFVIPEPPVPEHPAAEARGPEDFDVSSAECAAYLRFAETWEQTKPAMVLHPVVPADIATLVPEILGHPALRQLLFSAPRREISRAIVAVEVPSSRRKPVLNLPVKLAPTPPQVSPALVEYEREALAQRQRTAAVQLELDEANAAAKLRKDRETPAVEKTKRKSLFDLWPARKSA
jgi:thymidylate kinase